MKKITFLLMALFLFSCSEDATGPEPVLEYPDSKITLDRLIEEGGVWRHDLMNNDSALNDTSSVLKGLIGESVPSSYIIDGYLEVTFMRYGLGAQAIFKYKDPYSGELSTITFGSISVDESTNTIVFDDNSIIGCMQSNALCRNESIVVTGGMTMDYLVLNNATFMNPNSVASVKEIFKRMK